MDWLAWHDAYDDPSSNLSVRLDLIRGYLADAIGRAPAGPVRVVSLCAGQGRDVLHVLPGHPRRDDVCALLVESDERNAEVARRRAAAAGLTRVQVRQADASRVASFADALPAGVLLLCGIFGNVSPADIERTITAAPHLLAPGASVIWTRNRRPPDMTPWIRSVFAGAGFDEVTFHRLETSSMTGIGVHRLRASPAGLDGALPARALPDGPLFTFRRDRAAG